MIVFAKNYRGFRWLEVDISKITFLVGDNSSGKSSLLYLAHAICKNDLNGPPSLDEGYGVDSYDYFSPYFNNADVTFGFSGTTETSGDVAKLITVKKGNEFPEVIRCSYWVPKAFITLRKFRNSVQLRVLDAPNVLSAESALKMHESSDGFSTVQEYVPEPISEMPAIFIAADRKDERVSLIFRRFMSLDIQGCRLVSPIRALPEKFYPFKRKIDSQGAHFPSMWLDFVDTNADILDSVNSFGKESKLFDALQIDKISAEIENPPLIVSIKKNGKTFSLDQVGIGVSQVIPIITDSVYSLAGEVSPLFVMQPELHLHPVAQAAFGSYLHAMAKKGLRGIFETHSSFLLDRFRSDVRDYKGGDGQRFDEAEILFCENSEKGNKIRRIKINFDGSLGGDPASYHKFFVDELMRTMF